MRYISLLLLILLNQYAHADIQCKASSKNPTSAITPTINVSDAYIGNDKSVGQTIYRGKITVSTNIGISCDADFSNLATYLTVVDEPSGAPTIMQTAYGSGPVYPTNVSGVGVVLWGGSTNGNIIISKASPKILINASGTANTERGMKPTLDYSLIKTGPIASGSVVQASSFPEMLWTIPATAGYTGLPIDLLKVKLNGSVTYATQTCQTPDVNVNLGSYDISTTFRGIGATTKWVDSSILLTNCPTFSGYFADGNTTQSATDSSQFQGTTRTANYFVVSLKPANTVTDDIVALDKGDNAATGVGIQLGYSINPDTDTDSPDTLWVNGATWNATIPTDGRQTIRVPVFARYIQNGDKPTPGAANSKVVFNIYYK